MYENVGKELDELRGNRAETLYFVSPRKRGWLADAERRKYSLLEPRRVHSIRESRREERGRKGEKEDKERGKTVAD